MAQINYSVGGTLTSSIDDKLVVLVKVPGTLELRVTPTYADQVFPGHEVVMTYGDPRYISSTIVNKIKSSLEAALEEEKFGLEVEIDGLRERASKLSESRAARAKLFLDYASREKLRVDYGVARIIERGGDENLKKDQINPIVSRVYAHLSSKTGVPSSFKDKMRDYILSGIADEEAFQVLAQNIDPSFGNISRYNYLLNLVKQLNGRLAAVKDTSNLEQSISRAIEAMKSGQAYQKEIDFNGLRIDLREELKKLVGLEPAQYFLLPIDGVVEGKSENGLTIPLRYDSKTGNIPGELRPYFLSTTRFGQIIALFDHALGKMLEAYGHKDEEMESIARTVRSQSGRNFERGVFIRAVLPQDYKPSIVLYSDARLQIPNQRENLERIMEICRRNIFGLPRAVAEHFKMVEEEVKFNDLLLLQIQLMGLLPMPVYEAIEFSVRHSNIHEDLKHVARLRPEYRLAALRYQLQAQRIKGTFGADLAQIVKVSESTLTEARQLFGDQFSFIGKLEGD